MPDVSPTCWHLAHTTWFFEEFVLARAEERYQFVEPAFRLLFNSYYNAVGDQFPRARRGLLSRPSLAEVMAYRRAVDERMSALLTESAGLAVRFDEVIELGLNHEQQHQELIITDIKHVLSCNPLFPAYRERVEAPGGDVPAMQWVADDGGVREIGQGGEGFAFDNERPRHRVYLEPFEIASRLVTNGEYLKFIEAGGYRRPEWWLSLGWDAVRREGWRSPLYWVESPDGRRQFTLSGLEPLNLSEPVCHVSYFEADAYARWAGARLATEAEWETAAAPLPREGHFAERGVFHPQPPDEAGQRGMQQMFGDVWEWTSSPYTAYPGFTPARGALGEYNGKFMCNQYVLRGGSCATPRSHIRASYRNFFPPEARWQFSSIRLAR
jgi:ergothioneine biosynthesis protein EgtB